MIIRALALAALGPLLLIEAAFADILVGPSDAASLQARLRSAPPGTVIRVAPGAYPQGLRLTDLRGTPQAPIRITAGTGSGEGMEGRQDKKTADFSRNSGILLEKSSHVVIEGLSIAGYARGVTLGNCQNVTITGCAITDVGNYGIMSYRSDGVKILDNTIERSHNEHGIYISGAAKGVVIANNRIRDTHVNGIHINGPVVGPVVTDNRLDRTGSFPTKEGGAGLTLIGGTTAPVVERNRFSRIHGQCVTLDAPNAAIADNTFEACAWSGILGLAGGKDLRLTHNVFKEAGAIPLQLAPGIVGSVTASGNAYAPGQPVCKAGDGRGYNLKEWREMGKDAR